MLSSTEFKDSFSSIKTDIHEYLSNNGINQQNVVDLTTNRNYKTSLCSSLETIKLFFAEKFSDCKTIFNGLDDLAFSIFIEKCAYNTYDEKELIFEKGIDCNHYYFLVFGDIVLYSDARLDPEAKLLKTISGGLVFGHKVKDKLQYFAYAQSASVQLVKILKDDFDQIIEQMNDRKARNKMNFLKKYFPKFRTQPEEGISNLKEYFFRFEYVKGNKIIIDGEFDEYIYIILRGSCAAIKKIKRVPGLKEKLSENGIAEATHVILEKYGKYNL